jgi:plastocyanin
MPVAIAAGALVLLAAVAAVGIAMSSTDGDGGPPGEPTVFEELEVTIEIDDYDYRPQAVSVPSGATVTWVNNDNVPHTATEADDHWDTQVINHDESKALILDGPADYEYYCTLHPYMTGRIIVRAPE